MAQLQQTSITGSIASTGSLIISGSEPVQLPLLNSGSGEIDLATPYQLWFDSGDNNVKYHVKGAYTGGTWSASNNLLIARNGLSAAGVQNAAIMFGGSEPSVSNKTEEYNGLNYSSGGNMITARLNLSGFGGIDAGFAAGGRTPTIRSCGEEYNGTSWSAGGNLITARRSPGAAGTQNAGVVFAGSTPTMVACTEEYNGTSFAAGGAMITARHALGSAGTQNAAAAFGGNNPSSRACTEHYDGSAWSTGGDMNTARYALEGAGDCQYSAIAFMGITAPVQKSCTELYDGTTWINADPALLARRELGGTGTKFAAVAAGGESPVTAVTEEWTQTYVPPFSCFLPGVWSQGGATIVAGYSSRAGIQNSYSSVGPYNDTEAHENYNGTSWSTATDRTYSSRSGAGAGANADSVVNFGGFPAIATTVEWNGSSWATCGDMITGRTYSSGTGTQNDAGTVAGYNGAYRSCHENYGGATWSTATALPTTAGLLASAGSGADDNLVANNNAGGQSDNAYLWNGTSWSTLTNTPSGDRYARQGNGASTNDAMVFGGSIGGSPYAEKKETDVWDGTSWSSGGAMIQGGDMGYSGGSGATTSAGIAGPRYGVGLGYSSCVEEYDTTQVNLATYKCFLPLGNWSAGGNLITGRSTLFGLGTQNAALASGGYAGGGKSCNEEYNGTAWSAQTAVPTSRANSGAFGSTSAGAIAGGYNYPGGVTGCTSEWDGSSWNAGGTLIQGRYIAAGAGTQNAGLIFAGYAPPVITHLGDSEEYDGSSWSSGGAMITSRYALSGGGTQNAAIAFNGFLAPSARNVTEEYNGSSWATGGSTINSKYAAGSGEMGTQNSILQVAGLSSPASFVTTTEEYDGTSWSARSAYPINAGYLSSAGTNAKSSLAFGGYGPSNLTATYEIGADCVFSNLHCITRCLDATCTQI